MNAEVEQRSEKLAQAFMQYKDEKLSRENYMEMREERNNWKIFCEERKETLEQMILRLQKQQGRNQIFTKSSESGRDNKNQCGACGSTD